MSPVATGWSDKTCMTGATLRPQRHGHSVGPKLQASRTRSGGYSTVAVPAHALSILLRCTAALLWVRPSTAGCRLGRSSGRSATHERDVFCMRLSRFQRDELMDLVFLERALRD